MKDKINLGQFFTKVNPFKSNPFKSWFEEALKVSKNKTVLEPFACDLDIIKMLKEDYIFDYKGYDIEPLVKETIKQDTLKNYPKEHNIAITNPPYLASNSAKRKHIKWLYPEFDDLYKVSLKRMLDNTKYVAAIIPATFLQANIFQDRLSDFILLNVKMFEDTVTPVCLVLFKPDKTDDFNIWEFDGENNNFYNTYNKIQKKIEIVLKEKNKVNVKFNNLNGKYGILATDKSYKSIKFVKGNEIPNDKVKVSSRNMVRFSTDSNLSIETLNKKLQEFFDVGGEILIAPFKNLRNDNKYRRRLDFKTIRKIIKAC